MGTRTARRLAGPLSPLLAAAVVAACAQRAATRQPGGPDEHAGHGAAVLDARGDTVAVLRPQAAQGAVLPAGAAAAAERLARSPRHAEWVTVPVGASDSVRAWVVYPERSTKAPVVLVVHEIYGLTAWVRAVADQLAADGFVAVAPDLLTGKYAGPPDSLSADAGRALIQALDPAEVERRLDATARYAMSRPAALPRYGIIGFCWGGAVVWSHAARSPELSAGVAYYGAVREGVPLDSVRAPILGLYGGDDARVNATIPTTRAAMDVPGKSYEPHIFAGAGHGFLRAQDGKDGANLAASRAAWPLMLGFLRRHVGA